MKEFMNKPVEMEISSSEIVDFYCRCGDKKKTCNVHRLEMKDLNRILKGSGIKKSRKSKPNDPYSDIGMSRNDF